MCYTHTDQLQLKRRMLGCVCFHLRLWALVRVACGACVAYVCYYQLNFTTHYMSFCLSSLWCWFSDFWIAEPIRDPDSKHRRLLRKHLFIYFPKIYAINSEKNTINVRHIDAMAFIFVRWVTKFETVAVILCFYLRNEGTTIHGQGERTMKQSRKNVLFELIVYFCCTFFYCLKIVIRGMHQSWISMFRWVYWTHFADWHEISETMAFRFRHSHYFKTILLSYFVYVYAMFVCDLCVLSKFLRW